MAGRSRGRWGSGAGLRDAVAKCGREAVRAFIDSLLVGRAARLGLTHSQAELDGTVRALRGVIASAVERGEQRQWLWTTGGLGALGGALLWFLLTAMLPWGGTWLAGLAYGGRWSAGQAMMQDADPASWERMVRLYAPARGTAPPNCARPQRWCGVLPVKDDKY